MEGNILQAQAQRNCTSSCKILWSETKYLRSSIWKITRVSSQSYWDFVSVFLSPFQMPRIRAKLKRVQQDTIATRVYQKPQNQPQQKKLQAQKPQQQKFQAQKPQHNHQPALIWSVV